METSIWRGLGRLWRLLAHILAGFWIVYTRFPRLGEAERRLSSFLSAIQASPNGVILLDAELRIEWCNEAAAQHFGLDAQGDLLQHVGFLVREPAFTQYLARREFDRAMTMERWADRPIILLVQIIAYGAGRSLMLTRDVTQMAQADAMRRDFVANVSHEIRTPLTVVSGAVETMQSLPLSEDERAHYLDMMSQQAARMQALVNDLLTLSRLEGGPAPSDVECVDTSELLRRCEHEAKGLSDALYPPPAEAQRFDFTPLPGLRLAGSSSELHSACANLMNNAVRYTPPGGHIEAIWQMLPDGRAEFSVTDTGHGIAPEHLPRISERFYRIDRRSRESGGTGLGLAIAKHVAQRHGGELRITSKLGQGSRFALVFGAGRVRLAQPKAA